VSFIELQDITKIYRNDSVQTTVLWNVQLESASGEFIVLMGPSGSGKSTLLTILGAMNRPSAGRVLIDGIDVYKLSEEKRADFRREYLGFVFQQHHLVPYLTALENVCLPLVTSTISSGEKKRRAQVALERVGLSGKDKRIPGELSGGEQGRVAVARALVNEAPLLVADEPTGSLDSKTGDEIINLLRDLNRSGQTIFLVTHNDRHASFATKLIHLNDGQVTEIIDRPSIETQFQNHLSQENA
jgi:putative ABC transport system ATP-binding protein